MEGGGGGGGGGGREVGTRWVRLYLQSSTDLAAHFELPNEEVTRPVVRSSRLR